MENPENNNQQRATRRERSRETTQQEGPAYLGASKQAISKEADFKQDNGPAVSMTVVGETVTFTQHFHF